MTTPSHAINDQRWLAVLARDKASDGEFVYAVRSTGIYCRPSCPSRRALRENVELYDTTHAAKAAGYRACMRCKPDQMPLALQHNDLVVAACRALEASPGGLTLDQLADQAQMNPQHFQRLFKRITGITPKGYFKAVRARRLQLSLPNSASASVTNAVVEAGYSAASRLYETDAAQLGMSPRTFRDGAPNLTIRLACKPSDLGLILVAATEQGICAIEFGDSENELQLRLQARFPKARFVESDAVFQGWVGQVLAHVQRPSGVLELPLDVQGTVFQRQVWAALRDIPAGQTQTYSEVAERIGKPDSVRAVATACASNTLAVAIPCHRVVRKDGNLAGYRWGLERKAELLRREGSI